MLIVQAVQTPLCLASSSGHWEVVELLVGAGACVNQQDEVSELYVAEVCVQAPN